MVLVFLNYVRIIKQYDDLRWIQMVTRDDVIIFKDKKGTKNNNIDGPFMKKIILLIKGHFSLGCYFQS